MVGATMNAVGYWNDVATVHDAGTGVVPEYRRKGVSRGMFEHIIPQLEENGFARYSLEVIIGNDAAFKLYQGLGFEITREFDIYEAKTPIPNVEMPPDVEVKEIEYPDWDELRGLWSYEPSWQNSIDCVKRAKIINSNSAILGVYLKGALTGYAALIADSGKIAQIAIDEGHRRKGLGKVLLKKLEEISEHPLLITNIDTKAVGVTGLLEENGFEKTLSQYEMVRTLNRDH